MTISRRGFVGSLAMAAGIPRLARGAAPEPMISVLTCPRPGGASYLEQTLGEVERDCPDALKVIVCDGREVTRPGWTSMVVPPRARAPGAVDNKAPGWVPIWTAFAAGRDLLFLEDDVSGLAPGAFRQMLEHRPQDGVAFTSFYHRTRRPGVYQVGDFDMSQALKIPARTVAALWDFKVTGPPGDWANVVGVDLAIAVALKPRGWRYELAPSLVAHVGAVSAVAPPLKL